MNILITSGGTRENIDTVRSITNNSTGRLGSLIADVFAANSADSGHGRCKITYVHGENAIMPTCSDIETLPISNVQSLLRVIDELLETRKFDCIILAMAVSDYTPSEVLAADKTPLSDNKISSEHEELLVRLVRTPKVIERFRAIKPEQPEAILVGFKLLSGVGEGELLTAGHELLTRNSCDFVLANDLSEIAGDSHKATLIDEHGVVSKAQTKPQIAEIIYNAVMRCRGGRDRVSSQRKGTGT
jgi:phosphopantothenate-cysteine ligase